MISELFSIGSFSISPFGVLMALAFLGAYKALATGMARLGVGDDDDASSILFAAVIGGIVGAKVYYAALHGDWRLLFDRAGLVWYGGFAGGALAVVWTLWRRRLPVWPLVDAAAPALALGYSIGRIGCFLVGDDYGVPSDLPWAVAFPVGLPPTTAFHLRSELGVDVPASIADDTLLRVHPTQLYETLAAFAIFLVGRRLLGRHGRQRSGFTAAVVFALLAVERFLVEFVRAKDDRFLAGFTLAQAVSAGLLVVACVLAIQRYRSAREVAA